MPFSALLLAVGAVAVAPSWWGAVGRTAITWACRHWPPGLLLGGGALVLVWWAIRTLHRRRWPESVRRDRRMPTMVWLPLWAHVGGLLVLSVVIAVGMGALLWWALGRPRLEPLPTGPGAAAWTVANTFDAMKIVLSVVACGVPEPHHRR
ncbi:hypothetical protein [Micromonospora sp. NPDC005113]